MSLESQRCLIHRQDFLKQRGFLQAQRSLESESGLFLHITGREIDYAKGLILDGLWDDIESFVAPLVVCI